MGLGDLVEKGYNEITGNESVEHSSLKGFLSKYNSAEGIYVDRVDTLHTFDVQLEFLPSIAKKDDSKSLLDSIKDAASGALMDIGNNMTGGLLGSILRDINGKSIRELQKEFGGSHDGQNSFITYLSKGNLITENELGSQLIMDLSYYVQDITLPNLTIDNGQAIQNVVGQFVANGNVVKPQQNTFQINIINTKAPLIERIFYPWMREVTMPFWSYDDQPYTTANAVIDFSKHSDTKYIFVGCRPTQIESLAPSNALGSPVRNVTMTFDHMFITSDLKTYDSTLNKLWDVGKSMLNDAGKTLGL